MALIDLKDLDLFGNDAAEDEEADVFTSYVVERPELGAFIDLSRRICVARAYKGEGKSALLRLASSRLVERFPDNIVISCSANSVAPDLDSRDFSQWLRAWKGALFLQLACEIGARIGVAWSDDGMGLVEEAERQGFKKRNVVSAILGRLRPPAIEAGGVQVTGGGLEKPGASNPERILKRWASRGTPVWMLVDDVDLNFQNTSEQRAKVASFFVACRELVNGVSGLQIRAAVRPSVWTILKLEYEALSHVEQYIHDLTWSEDAVRELLAKRVEAYLRRRGKWADVEDGLPPLGQERDRQLIALVFSGSMEWGEGRRPPHVLVYTLSKRRPRWAIELSKEAAAAASARRLEKISRDDIISTLTAFGRRRIADTVAEFRSQCPQIGELIGAFSRSSEQFTTAEVLTHIERKILTHMTPEIVGVAGRATARDVAAFLFEIGLFFGRRELPDDAYEHVSFSDQPDLFRSRTDMDRGLSWEVHPVFRQALELRDAAGREYPRPPRTRGARQKRS